MTKDGSQVSVGLADLPQLGGEFYVIEGDAALLEAPDDWKFVAPRNAVGRHFLFYFRDNTFECIPARCVFEASGDNALLRLGRVPYSNPMFDWVVSLSGIPASQRKAR